MSRLETWRRRLTVIRPMSRRLRGARSPWFVTWALTDRCNYTCDHCGCWRAPSPELNTEQVLRYAHELVELGVLGVNLCGGEVLLRKDVVPVIEILRDGGVITRITTNGRLVPARMQGIRRLNRLKLSLDGPPDLHEQVRGPGSWEALVEATRLARAASVPVQLNTVLTRRVLERLDEVLETAALLQAPLSVQPLELRHQEAASGVDAARPEPAAMRAGLDRLIALRQSGDRRIGSSLGTLRYLHHWPDLPPIECHAGARFARILADGRVVACDRPQAPRKAPPPPLPGTPPPGVRASFARLERAGACSGCWRNNTIELNRALGGSQDAARALRRWV